MLNHVDGAGTGRDGKRADDGRVMGWQGRWDLGNLLVIELDVVGWLDFVLLEKDEEKGVGVLRCIAFLAFFF